MESARSYGRYIMTLYRKLSPQDLLELNKHMLQGIHQLVLLAALGRLKPVRVLLLVGHYTAC